jgi:hypothetical protein
MVESNLGFGALINYYKKMTNEEKTELFVIFETEFVNEDTGQVVTLTTTCGSYKELGKYLTEMEKKSWKMLKVTKKKS